MKCAMRCWTDEADGMNTNIMYTNNHMRCRLNEMKTDGMHYDNSGAGPGPQWLLSYKVKVNNKRAAHKHSNHVFGCHVVLEPAEFLS